MNLSPWDSKEHEILRKKLLKGVDLVEEINNLTILNGQEEEVNTTNKPSGLSFMKDGQIFHSKSDV